MSRSKDRNSARAPDLKIARGIWGLAVSLSALAALACARSSDERTRSEDPVLESKAESLAPMPGSALDPEFLLRGMLALKKRMGEGAELLELRAIPQALSIQVRAGEAIHEFVYLETDDPKVEGHIEGPRVSPLLGQGTLQDNLFPASDLDVIGIGRSFDVAKKAIDPDDGLVEKVIVRRFFPFGDGVRARIYVGSPRMPGSIDTNPTGVPLKR